MRVFVTGVNGLLGHDVMNELAARGWDGIGSDIHPAYTGVQDGSAVCGVFSYFQTVPNTVISVMSFIIPKMRAVLPGTTR